MNLILNIRIHRAGGLQKGFTPTPNLGVSLRDRGGFTLIELLVSVAIFGLLSSILLVSLNQARLKAKDAKKIATLSQITKAIEFYYDTHKQYPAIHNCVVADPSPPPPCVSEYADRNWDDLVVLLRADGLIAEETPVKKNLLQKITDFVDFSLPASAANSYQDPSYPKYKFEYMASIIPPYQSYRLRTTLENGSAEIFKQSVAGKFIYNDEPTGPNSCDANFNYFCFGPGGTYDTFIPGKPVVYLYPQKTQEVSVKISPKSIRESMPEYGTGWLVFADPDGTIHNQADKTDYPYLFWEGESQKPTVDKSKGFVVASDEVEAFLKNKLNAQGLNTKEANEFIEYWAPRMQGKKFVFVHFLPQAEYDRLVPMQIEPKPDTLIRVYILFKRTDVPFTVEAQHFAPAERKGFTVVEWGGDRSEMDLY